MAPPAVTTAAAMIVTTWVAPAMAPTDAAAPPASPVAAVAPVAAETPLPATALLPTAAPPPPAPPSPSSLAITPTGPNAGANAANWRLTPRTSERN